MGGLSTVSATDLFQLATGNAPTVSKQNVAAKKRSQPRQHQQPSSSGANPFRGSTEGQQSNSSDLFNSYAQPGAAATPAPSYRTFPSGANPFRAEEYVPQKFMPAAEPQASLTVERRPPNASGRPNPFAKAETARTPRPITADLEAKQAASHERKTSATEVAPDRAIEGVTDETDIFALSASLAQQQAVEVRQPAKPNPFEAGLAKLAEEMQPSPDSEPNGESKPRRLASTSTTTGNSSSKASDRGISHHESSEQAVFDVGLLAVDSVDQVAAEEVDKPVGTASGPELDARNKKTKKPAPRALPRLLSIHEASLDLTPKPQEIDTEQTDTKLPENLGEQQLGSYQAAAFAGNELVRHAAQDYLWMSPMMRHRPLYFEQPNLERYGSHFGGNCCASALATGHFLGRVLTLPYQVAAHPPSECVYTLGVYRPGSCNPHYLHASPISGRGMIAQAATVTGLVFLFP